MGKFFNLDSPLMMFLSKMADLMILNVITLLLCIPIITAGSAMTALYYMTLKIVKGEETYIVRGYFKSFKENFKQATIIWILALVVGLILIGDFMILGGTTQTFGKVLKVLIMIIAVVYIFTMTYLFPVLSRFENTIKNTIRNAFLMSVLSFPRTILMIVINVLPTVLLILVPQVTPFVMMFGFAVPAYLCSMQFKKIFSRYEPEEEEAGDGELETLSFIREEEEAKRRALEEAGHEEAADDAQPVEPGVPEEAGGAADGAREGTEQPGDEGRKEPEAE